MSSNSKNSDIKALLRHANAHGEYGYSPTNPLLAQDISESKNLLSELVLSDGSPISFEREGSTTVSNLSRPVDKYAIYDSSGEKLTTLYVYCYHMGTAYSAPEGFALASVLRNKQARPWWKFWGR